ncbi:hypothetical protein [Nocardioides dilutus]
MLGRRGVLAGALGLAALSACDVDDLRPPEDEARPTPSPSGSATVEPDADTRLADDTAYAIAVAAVAVDRVQREFPRLRRPLQPLVRMHRAHGEVLPVPGDRSIPVPAPSGTRGEALRRVRAAEEALQRTLVAAAAEAQSGALARLLASMSASVTQHVAQHLPAGRG